MVRTKTEISEREFARRAGVARKTLRDVEAGRDAVTVASLAKVAAGLELELALFAYSVEPCDSRFSVVGVAYAVAQDGFDSWKGHFFELVDVFRRTLDPRLLLLPPPRELDPKLAALLSAIVITLCEEAKMDPPSWVSRRAFLDTPWFLAGAEALKASAIIESPLAFRARNIFVLGNFMARA